MKVCHTMQFELCREKTCLRGCGTTEDDKGGNFGFRKMRDTYVAKTKALIS